MSSASAFQTAYRQEIVNGFDKTVSVLRDTVTTEYMDKGGSAVFLVADTINQVAHIRGINGLIPADSLALTQNTATLVPWYKLVTVSDFNIFASQGDLNKPMQRATMAAINRQIDNDIIANLNLSTTTISAGGPATVSMITKAQGILGLNKVADDGNTTLLITPAARTYLMQTTEFSNSLYVKEKVYTDGKPNFGDMRQTYDWCGVNVIVDPTLPNIGTSTAVIFLYNKASIGQAINKDSMDFDMDYNREQKYSWANAKMFMGSKVLQTTGIVAITHDDSAIVSG